MQFLTKCFNLYLSYTITSIIYFLLSRIVLGRGKMVPASDGMQQCTHASILCGPQSSWRRRIAESIMILSLWYLSILCFSHGSFFLLLTLYWYNTIRLLLFNLSQILLINIIVIFQIDTCIGFHGTALWNYNNTANGWPDLEKDIWNHERVLWTKLVGNVILC